MRSFQIVTISRSRYARIEELSKLRRYQKEYTQLIETDAEYGKGGSKNQISELGNNKKNDITSFINIIKGEKKG